MRLLDLFCCEGGACTGYHRAGFDVTGVDIEYRPAYPFTFRQADAFDLLEDVSYLRTFDLVHASPPCQGYTTMSNRWRGAGGKADEWGREIAQTREALERAGVPYIIENVLGARADMRSPILLRGGHFGLGVDRPRLFESNLPIAAPPPAKPVTGALGVYGKAPDWLRLYTRSDGTEQRAASSIEEAATAMGDLSWMTWDGLRECIPPAFTEYLGLEARFHLGLAA